MTLFRPHRGLLADAMREVREVASYEELARHLASSGLQLQEVRPYDNGPDDRIGWRRTFIVLARVSGVQQLLGEPCVAGFTDGPLTP